MSGIGRLCTLESVELSRSAGQRGVGIGCVTFSRSGLVWPVTHTGVRRWCLLSSSLRPARCSPQCIGSGVCCTRTAESAALPAIPRPSRDRIPRRAARTRVRVPRAVYSGLRLRGRGSSGLRERAVSSFAECTFPSPVPITSDRASANRGAAQRAGALSVRATPGSRSPQKSSI